ncbi:MAG: hypothetical protein ACNYNY_06085 [Candidatus Oxydemutatoraceae bacterium WSBS_2016_MAG_OTU14]
MNRRVPLCSIVLLNMFLSVSMAQDNRESNSPFVLPVPKAMEKESVIVQQQVPSYRLAGIVVIDDKRWAVIKIADKHFQVLSSHDIWQDLEIIAIGEVSVVLQTSAGKQRLFMQD